MVSSHVWPSLPLPGTLGGIRDRRRGLLRAPGGGPPRGPSSILDRESSGIGGRRICARGANCLGRVSPWPSCKKREVVRQGGCNTSQSVLQAVRSVLDLLRPFWVGLLWARLQKIMVYSIGLAFVTDDDNAVTGHSNHQIGTNPRFGQLKSFRGTSSAPAVLVGKGFADSCESYFPGCG